MNGVTGTTNSNLGITEGIASPYGQGLMAQNPSYQMQNLMIQLQSLMQELNEYSSPAYTQTTPQTTPWSAVETYGHSYPSPMNPWDRMYRLSNLLREIRGQIQHLEDCITKRSYQSIQGTMKGLNHATQSLQTSQILRHMDSIIEEIYRTVYQQNPGIS